ncbi:MAG: nucleotidyltransferase family protein [Chloroflexota bacterium]
MDAVVIAGGVPEPEDPLYAYTQGIPKALLDICGKPMIQWVLDALCQAETIERVIVIGLSADSGVTCEKAMAFIPSQGNMLANIRAGALKVLELNPNAEHVLLASSDVPGITHESIDWVVRTTMQTDDDAYYNVISREAMEARYPTSNRSYVRLRDVQVCGGDVNVVRTKTVTENHDLWDRIVESRKNALKQAALIGYDTLILLLLRLITLEGAVKKVTRRLAISGRAVLCPYAEIGMDVDKPHQLEIMRADLERRNAT